MRGKAPLSTISEDFPEWSATAISSILPFFISRSGSIWIHLRKCSRPFKKVTFIVVPWCSTLFTSISPPCRRISFRVSMSPMPLPVIFELIAFTPRKCILNNLLCSLDDIPIPVSFTSSFQVSLFSCTETRTIPYSGVYFIAFEIRFFKIESIFSLSNHTSSPSSTLQSQVKSKCLKAA